MSTIKYKNAIKESPKVGEKVEEEKPTLKALAKNVTLDECGCARKITFFNTVFENLEKCLNFYIFASEASFF